MASEGRTATSCGRTGTSRGGRSPRRIDVWGVVAAACLVVAGCTTSTVPDDGVTSSPTNGTTPPSTSEPSSPQEPAWVTAWFVLDTRSGPRLARERQDMIDDSAVFAIEAMIKGPRDPDYWTQWHPGTKVLSVREEPGLITVDLSAEARVADVGSAGAALMVQQLVWTVTEAAEDPDAGVILHIDGEPAGELWGALTWDDPEVRADPLDVRMLVQLDSPVPDEVFASGTVAISGEAAAFEANVPWRLYDGDGTLLESGFTTTSAGQEFAPFSFNLDLDAGEYIIEIVEDDPSDGEAGAPMSDTRTFFVD